MGGIALAASTWARGPWLSPSDPGFDAWVASSGFAAWSSASLNGTVWLAFGFLALAAALAPGAPRLPLAWGTFLSVLGLMVFLVPMGMYRIVWPLGAETAAAVEAVGTYQVWAAFSFGTILAGVALVALCVLRSGWPPWMGITLAAGGVAASLPWWFPLEVAGTVALAAATLGLTWHVWRTPAPP